MVLVLNLPDGTIVRRPEHQVVWEVAHRHALPQGWVVHHRNGITCDNRPENLLAMPRGLHVSLHSALTRAEAALHGLALQEELERVCDCYGREAKLLLRRRQNMAKKKGRVSCLDLKDIRLFLNLTMEQMGARVTKYARKRIARIPGSRINEWEGDVRSVPDYVFEAVFHMIVHDWTLRREKVTDPGRIDADFATLLDPGLGYAIGLYNRIRHADDQIHRLDAAAEVSELIGVHFQSLAAKFGSTVAQPPLPPVE